VAIDWRCFGKLSALVFFFLTVGMEGVKGFHLGILFHRGRGGRIKCLGFSDLLLLVDMAASGRGISDNSEIAESSEMELDSENISLV